MPAILLLNTSVQLCRGGNCFPRWLKANPPSQCVMIKQTVLSQTARGGIRPLLLPPSFHSLLYLPLLAAFHCSDRNQDDPGKVRQGLMQVGEYGARSRWPRIQKSGLKMMPRSKLDLIRILKKYFWLQSWQKPAELEISEEENKPKTWKSQCWVMYWCVWVQDRIIVDHENIGYLNFYRNVFWLYLVK